MYTGIKSIIPTYLVQITNDCVYYVEASRCTVDTEHGIIWKTWQMSKSRRARDLKSLKAETERNGEMLVNMFSQPFSVLFYPLYFCILAYKEGIYMEQIMNYVKPELVVVALVLYFIGTWLKKADAIKDKYIPMILGGIGIVLCAIWVFANTSIGNSQEVALATFTAIVQGILVAGLSTYADQIMKQIGKED